MVPRISLVALSRRGATMDALDVISASDRGFRLPDWQTATDSANNSSQSDSGHQSRTVNAYLIQSRKPKERRMDRPTDKLQPF